MRNPLRPLTSQQARQTLVARLRSRVDRYRQFQTDVGNRPQRVFLVWTKFSGAVRGEGHESIVASVEILPTPRVADMTALTYRTSIAGTYPDGSVRVDQISQAFTEDMLRGLFIPKFILHGGQQASFGPGPCHCSELGDNVEFSYWIHEDGRGDAKPEIKRFRLMSNPFRNMDSVDWVVILQRADRDPTRAGNPVQVGGPDDIFETFKAKLLR